jgi:hypothetical protein
MTIFLAALGVIWLIFGLVWLVGALTAKRTVRRNWFGAICWRVGIAASVIMLYNLLRDTPYVTGELSILPLNVLGVICATAGVALAVWARVYLGRNWGDPLTVKENPELVTSGPYAYIRNPVYTGVLLAMLGSTLVDWWWAVPLAWSVAYFVYASRGEEQLMLREFPDTYPAYKARTWRLIPYIH